MTDFLTLANNDKHRFDRQQLWNAVITGDTVTKLSIPIRSRGKSPKEGQR